MAITATQLRVLVSDPPTPDAPQIFDDGHYEAIGSMETNLYKAAGSPAGFISHETASIRLCPAQNVAKSTGVLDLA